MFFFFFSILQPANISYMFIATIISPETPDPLFSFFSLVVDIFCVYIYCGVHILMAGSCCQLLPAKVPRMSGLKWSAGLLCFQSFHEYLSKTLSLFPNSDLSCVKNYRDFVVKNIFQVFILHYLSQELLIWQPFMHWVDMLFSWSCLVAVQFQQVTTQ